MLKHIRIRYSNFHVDSIITGGKSKGTTCVVDRDVTAYMVSTEYYDFRPSSTAVDTASLHALDPTEPRKRKQIGFLLAPIVKVVSNFVSNLLLSF